jgi:uncharacterized membrane protein YphA (DoxX/SURF4 family)
LLLLRAAVGITAVNQGVGYLSDDGNPTFEFWLVGLLNLGGGLSLLVGFLTPLAGTVVALATLGIVRSWFPLPAANLFTTPLPAILVVTMATAVALLGPGSLSADSRLFGRRQIIIPHGPRSPRS